MNIEQLTKRVELLEKLVKHLYCKLGENIVLNICQICGAKGETYQCELCLAKKCINCLRVYESSWEKNHFSLCSNECLQNARILEAKGPLSQFIGS